MQPLEVTTGRYALVSQLHQGERSGIFRARADGACGFEKFIALKCLRAEAARNESTRRRFIRQAVISSKLCHYNVAGVYDFYEEDGCLYLAMELVEGTTLASILTYQRRVGQMFPPEVTLAVIFQLLDALDYLHKARDPITNARLEMVHRDVRPMNVMIDHAGVVKLIGFAHCQDLETDPDLDHERWLTPYTAPELLTTSRVGPTADLFSLGVILYELLTLEPVFTSRDPASRAQELAALDLEARLDRLPPFAESLRPILRQALARVPAERFSSAGAMSRALRAHYRAEPGPVPVDVVLRDAVGSAMLLELSDEIGQQGWEAEPTEAFILESALRPSRANGFAAPELTLAAVANHDAEADDFDDDLEDEDDLDDLELDEDPYGRGGGSSGGWASRSRTVNLAIEPWARSETTSTGREEVTDGGGADEASQATRVTRLESDAPLEILDLELSAPDPPVHEHRPPADGPGPYPALELAPGYEWDDAGAIDEHTAASVPARLDRALDGLNGDGGHYPGDLEEAPPAGMPADQDASRSTLASPTGLEATTAGAGVLLEGNGGGAPSAADGFSGDPHAAGHAAHEFNQTHPSIPATTGVALLFLAPHAGLRCPVPERGLALGRAHSNDLVLADLEVAPRHATIVLEGGRWWLRAQRGEILRVDGREVSEIPLRAGQLVMIGRSRFTVLMEPWDDPGGVVDYRLLEAELTERFPEVARQEQFRAAAGLQLNDELLRAPAGLMWHEALRRLREAPDPRPLRRLLDALVQVQPEARQVQRARHCLLTLEKWS